MRALYRKYKVLDCVVRVKKVYASPNGVGAEIVIPGIDLTIKVDYNDLEEC